MAIVEQVLHSLQARPKTLSQLASDLGVSSGLVHSAILQLQRGNYVAPALPGASDCAPACGKCAMNSMCPSASSQAEPQEAWRLTAKGSHKVASPG